MSLQACIASGMAIVFSVHGHAQETAQGTASSMPRIDLALPSKVTAAVTWILPPANSARIRENPWTRLRFAVDDQGRPWLGHDQRVVAHPLKGFQVELEKPYQDFVSLESGPLLFCTETDLGMIPKLGKLEPPQTGVPLVAFQPVAALPVRDCRLFPGEGGALYIVGENPKSQEHEVYLLQRTRGRSPKARSRMGRTLRKLLAIKDTIAAVSGDGEKTFVAVGRLVMSLGRGSKGAKGVFLHPERPITDLAFSRKTGLFYATDAGVGFVGSKEPFEFLKWPGTKIRLRGGDLYVLLGDSLGVIRIEGLGMRSVE